jgi:hypothetical protein
MTTSELLSLLENDPQVQAVAQAVLPYIPVMKRMGEEFYTDVLRYATNGMWNDADRLVWEKMTDEEREQLSLHVLSEARDAVDRQYERDSFMKQSALNIAMKLLMSLL